VGGDLARDEGAERRAKRLVLFGEQGAIHASGVAPVSAGVSTPASRGSVRAPCPGPSNNLASRSPRS
jgi:hypothetical protein